MSSLSISVAQELDLHRKQSIGRRRSGLFIAALLLLAAGGIHLQQSVDLRQMLIWFTGAGIGIVLYRTSFGFAAGWRSFIVERRGDGLRANMLLLALTTVIFLPLMQHGSLFGNDINGIIRPIGLSLLAGAFLFGIGMQLAGACASGTLSGLGGGRRSLLLTLACIVTGATLASAHWEWWSEQPAWLAFSARHSLGLSGALLANLAIIGMLTALTIVLEKRRHGGLQRIVSRTLLWGALALTLLNLATLVLTGRPWVIAGAFPLWGAHLSEALGFGWDFMFWEYWSSDAGQTALESAIHYDTASVMNIAIVFGALAAAGWAQRYSSDVRQPASIAAWLAAAVGGLLLGYGAVIGLGCNIGAFVAGVVSGSLHGWVWFIAAFAGTMVGVALRPWFGLTRV